MQLTAITRKSALMAILLLVVILVAAALRSRLAPFAVELANSEYSERVVSLVVSMIILFAAGIVEGKMLPRSGLSKGYCTLPIPIYGILACGLFVAPNIMITAIASFSFAMAIYLLLRSLHHAGEKDSVFFAAMLLGGMVLLYPPCVVLAGVIPIAIFTLALSPRQMLLMAVGYLLPIFGASYIMWYLGGEFLDLSKNIAQALMLSRMDAIAQIPYAAILIVVAVVAMLLWGAVYAIARPDKMFLLTRVRRSLYLFVWVTLLSATILLFPSCDLSAAAIIAVPLTILLCFVLNLLPNNHATIAYWVLLGLFVLHLFVA